MLITFNTNLKTALMANVNVNVQSSYLVLIFIL